MEPWNWLDGAPLEVLTNCELFGPPAGEKITLILNREEL
jgi:hypothetical protein